MNNERKELLEALMHKYGECLAVVERLHLRPNLVLELGYSYEYLMNLVGATKALIGQIQAGVGKC